MEKELGTSQIPVAFFTDRTGEIDVADGLNFLFLQGAQHLKNDRKTAGIVADAGGMADTVFVDTADADDIAFTVHGHFGKAQLLQAAHQILTANSLMKGGRLNLGECNLVLQGQIGIALYCLQTVGNTLLRLQLGGRCRHIRMHCGEFGRFCHTSFA